MDTLSSFTDKNIPEFLSGGGEMGQLIRDYDWSASPLGPVSTWPQSLRTCVRIMLISRQPIWIGWGKSLIKLYNDPYKTIVGGKHPWALGEPASVVWKDIWRDIEPMLKTVMEKDQGTYVESQLLIMERNGYPEETYYTFSYTPIPGDDGTTTGMICANSDDTDRIITERQLKTLTQLGKNLTDASSSDDVIADTIATLTENPHDFPFALFYSLSGNNAVLSGTTALAGSQDLVPIQVDLNTDKPIAKVLRKVRTQRKIILLEGIKEIFGEMPRGAWEVPPEKAIVLPIVQSNSRDAFGFLIVGFNPYRLLDEKYSSFFSLIADQVATSFSDVYILEEERKRAQALAEVDKAKTIFFSNISHEFRTPLTLLLGPIEDALNDPTTNENNRVRMEVAFRNALRMQRLVNTLLDFSRIEAGRMEGKFSRVDIAALTQDLASTFRSAIEKAGMELKVHLSPISAEVYADIDMWEKIILNLVSNAFKYSKQGSITVQVTEVGKDVNVIISDTGIGIPGDQLDKIFSRFHRVQNTEGRSQEGTGIGLAMVKELVKLHHGTITVSSELGKGSSFTVSIPTGRMHLPDEKIANIPAQLTVTEPSSFVHEAIKWTTTTDESTSDIHLTSSRGNIENNGQARVKIVLADDNADMRDYVQRLLSEQFDVITAIDGQEAFNKMLAHRPELLLSDIMMPKLDGYGLLKKVRSHPELKNIPVIFLSARAGEEAKVEGLDAGADDYVVKPFSAKELIVRVTNHIRINQVRRETEQQFYHLFLQAPAFINVFKGPEHRYEFFHPRNKIFFGDVDFTGITVKEALPELEGQGIFELLNQAYHEGKTIAQHDRPVQLKNEKGELVTRYMNFTYQPWYDLRGNIQGVLNFAIDVTDSVESRKKTEESERQFKTVLVQSPSIFVILTGENMQISFVNEPLLRSWGRTPDIVGKPLLEALPELREQAFPLLLEKVYQSGVPHYGKEERAVLLKNGVEVDVYYNYVYQPIVETDNRVSGITIMATDVTEQVVARKQIEESENRFRTLAETLPQLVWMTDAGGNQIYASSRWKEYSGIEPKTEAWHLLVHPDDAEIISKAWTASVGSGNIYRVEVRLKNKAGDYRWFYGQGEPIYDDHDVIVRWIGSFTDIHDQKEIENRLEKLVAERTLELHRSNEDLQQFAHVASHDLKEPVRKIRTFGGRLETEYAGILPPRAKEFLGKIQTATDRMYAMIEGVLNYSTLNAHHQSTGIIDLNTVIETIASDLELTIQQKGAQIVKEKLPPIEGAAVLIYQLFYNLANNSLKFAKADVSPVIRISGSLNETGNQVTIEFADNGIGFEPAHAEKIFDTFTRLNAKDKYEGTGLGLALCKKIVERHHGTIFAKGAKGEGANFTIVLPALQPSHQI